MRRGDEEGEGGGGRGNEEGKGRGIVEKTPCLHRMLLCCGAKVIGSGGSRDE
jgi:hypothetical protein